MVGIIWRPFNILKERTLRFLLLFALFFSFSSLKSISLACCFSPVRMTGARGKGAVKNTTTALIPADERKAGKRKASVDRRSLPKAKKEKKAKKDPNKPKRPPSAFFVFLEEFRTTFKKENPNVKAVSAVGKAAGEKWKSMSEEDKAPYEAKARKRKADYEKQMKDYNKKQETSANGAADDEDAEEANDVENEASGGEDEEEEDDDDED
ncbi:hypothetical protein V6N11_020986 [Hibiscus sabdariffa]|uniref:Uncharacterized protein n=2 Tax=Hibiscus sabdariffa TaxID=183260 RepID=A0ABR2BZ30_9ROSI